MLVVAPFSCSLSFCFSINCYNLCKADGPELFTLKALLGALSGGTWTKEGWGHPGVPLKPAPQASGIPARSAESSLSFSLLPCTQAARLGAERGPSGPVSTLFRMNWACGRLLMARRFCCLYPDNSILCKHFPCTPHTRKPSAIVLLWSLHLYPNKQDPGMLMNSSFLK